MQEENQNCTVALLMSECKTKDLGTIQWKQHHYAAVAQAAAWAVRLTSSRQEKCAFPLGMVHRDLNYNLICRFWFYIAIISTGEQEEATWCRKLTTFMRIFSRSWFFFFTLLTKAVKWTVPACIIAISLNINSIAQIGLTFKMPQPSNDNLATRGCMSQPPSLLRANFQWHIRHSATALGF